MSSPLSAIRLLPVEHPTLSGLPVAPEPVTLDGVPALRVRRGRRQVLAAVGLAVVVLVALAVLLGGRGASGAEAAVPPAVHMGSVARTAAVPSARVPVAEALALLDPSLREAVTAAIVVQVARATSTSTSGAPSTSP